jgi:hypothetical protein
MKRQLSSVALPVSWIIPVVCHAWDGVTTGRISSIAVTGAGNLPFRVYLDGSPLLCGPSGMAEGYLDDTDSNYKVYVAALMMAKAMGSTVTLHADVGSYNRCRIGYVVVH